MMELIVNTLPVLGNALALFFAWLFSVAGVHKFNPGNRAYYQQVFAGYGVKLPVLADALKLLVAVIELSIAIMLLLPDTRWLGALAAGVLLGVYAAMMAKTLWQGQRQLQCGCSGPGLDLSVSPALLLRNVGFMLLLMVPAFSQNSSVGAVWLLSLAPAICLVIAGASLEQLLSNQQKIRQLRS